MRLGGSIAALVLALTPAARANDGAVMWTDQRWDATPRRTDSNNAGTLGVDTRLPDLLRLTISAWTSPTASTNPYNGWVESDPSHAHLFRIDIVFDGLVNPPGQLGDGEVAPYEPFAYGPNPVYGFFEFDVDQDRDTGGELGPAAKTRYLANAARFGCRPVWNGDRAVVWGTDRDRPFGAIPNYRASGADFVLGLCGCFDPVIVSEGGNGNHRFDPGETWIVRGPFFQRTGGYQGASFCFGGASGVPGVYDPQVNLRFSHSLATNQTTVSLVYALDPVGAGQLAGQDPEPIDYDAGNQTCIQEALQDVIDATDPANGLVLTGPVWTLAHRWYGRDVHVALNPTLWRATAIVGTASSTQVDSPYIWTDIGFGEIRGDFNQDNQADNADRAIVRQQIILLDAGPLDGEGPYLDNGQVQIIGFGGNFWLYDVNGDGLINEADLNWYCTADFDGDGHLSVNDFSSFLNAFVAHDPRADLNHTGTFEVSDVIIFANAFAAGCP